MPRVSILYDQQVGHNPLRLGVEKRLCEFSDSGYQYVTPLTRRSAKDKLFLATNKLYRQYPYLDPSFSGCTGPEVLVPFRICFVPSALEGCWQGRKLMAGLPDMIGSHTGTQDNISHFRKFTCDGCWPIHRGCYAVGYNLRVQLIQPPPGSYRRYAMGGWNMHIPHSMIRAQPCNFA